MAITVLPATEADLHALGRIHDRAFRPSIITRLIWGAVTEEDSAASFARYFSKALKKPRTKVFKAVDSADGEIKGLSFWMLPLADGEEPEKDKEPSEPAPGTNKELAKEFFGMLDKCKEQYEKRHLHLGILAIDPAAQGKGIGKALLDWGLRYADETSVPLYLEASDEGLELYRKKGFVHLGDAARSGPGGQFVVWPMRREPQSAAAEA